MHARTDAPTLICHMSWLVSVVEPMSHPHTPLMQQQMADTCVLVCRRSRQHPVLRHVFLCVGGADNISKDDPLHRVVSPPSPHPPPPCCRDGLYVCLPRHIWPAPHVYGVRWHLDRHA